MKKTLKYLFYLTLFPLLAVFIYFLIAYLFFLFPKKPIAPSTPMEKIYLLYNEMHSDIVFDLNDFNLSLFPEFKTKKRGYLAFGWGDKETYLTTPQWSDLSLSISFKALFLNTPTLMHVSYIPNIHYYSHRKSILLSKRQKEHLKASILKSFNFQGERYQGYGKEDFFYTAHHSYNLIDTCNTWTGDRLRESNLSISYWTPFSWSVVDSLP